MFFLIYNFYHMFFTVSNCHHSRKKTYNFPPNVIFVTFLDSRYFQKQLLKYVGIWEIGVSSIALLHPASMEVTHLRMCTCRAGNLTLSSLGERCSFMISFDTSSHILVFNGAICENSLEGASTPHPPSIPNQLISTKDKVSLRLLGTDAALGPSHLQPLSCQRQLKKKQLPADFRVGPDKQRNAAEDSTPLLCTALCLAS